MIARQFRIDFRAPGVDSAAQTLDVFEAVPWKYAAASMLRVAFVIVNDEQICRATIAPGFPA